MEISIHAPTWGATSWPQLLFNVTGISIHAPTWGATQDSPAVYLSFHRFQSTHPRGVRPKVINKVPVQIPFQSTHPRGVRPGFASRTHSRSYFNPRTHVGCDGHPFIAAGPGDGISIHAPTWGATYGRVRVGEHRLISIHAPTWGATIGDVHMLIEINISIHAPTWGATGSKYGSPQGVGISIHAPTWGATWRRITSDRALSNFNPRTHVGCDLLWQVISN